MERAGNHFTLLCKSMGGKVYIHRFPFNYKREKGKKAKGQKGKKGKKARRLIS